MTIDKTSETMLGKPEEQDGAPGIHLGATELDADHSAASSPDRTALSPGQTIADGYVVINQIGSGGSQASVYIARKEGKKCAIKLYNKGYKPSEEFVKKLKNHHCPYVADLIDYGYEDDLYYEIFKYYDNGTLEDKGKCSITFIKDVVVPHMNEGLHFLHTLNGTGIVHGDIKPSNIFLSNDGEDIVIGDFGISSYLNKDGKLIDDVKGTPEYALPTISFFGKTAKTPAYDYASFGLVLIKLATGYSLFQGLSRSSIIEMCEKGLAVPDTIESSLKRLISGLIVLDEQVRFGYNDVKQWCEGQYIQIKTRSIYEKEDLIDENEEPAPLVFGVIDGRIVFVSDLNELADAISENWERTKKLLKKSQLLDFIGQFDKKLEKDVREYSMFIDADKAVFFTLYAIAKQSKLFYKGKDYGDARSFINGLEDGATQDELDIINNGLLEHYLQQCGYDADLISDVSQIINLDRVPKELIPQILYYLFASEKEYVVHGKAVSNIDEFINEIVKMEIEEIEELAEDPKLMAWLYSIGYKEDALKLLGL